jgi:hypothetical protein
VNLFFKKHILWLLFVTVFNLGQSVMINAQQLDRIGQEDPLKINGGLSVNQLWRNNVQPGVKPYSLVATGNLTANLYGMTIPFSFSWSNERWTYTQPFNRFSLSPSYKWATLHLGWSSMNFSSYSLSGHSFMGVGAEIAPGDKFRLSAMHGELVKASKGDTLLGIEPRYRRMGTGLKGDYSFEKGEISLMFFHGQDDTQQSIQNIDSLGIIPMENFTVGTRVSLRPISKLSVVSEFHLSSLSHDRRLSSSADLDGAATRQYHAALLQLAYSMNIGSIGAGVEYVEPGYETLGAYYTVNDFINYTINVSTSMLAGRVNLTANTGIRQNNLNNMADSNQRDAISSVAVGIIPTESLMFNLSYSNFYNYTHVRPLIDELVAQTEYELMDTLRFTQINENINLGANWRIVETETISHGLMLNLGFQQATQTQNSAVENAGSRFMNGSGGYQYGLKDLNLNFALNVNYSRNKSPESIMESLGPNLSVRKSFPERNLSGNFSLGWNGTYTDGTNNGSITTTRLNISYKLKEVHQFGFSTAYNHRNYNASKSQQATATLNYSYSFGWPKQKNPDQNNL